MERLRSIPEASSSREPAPYDYGLSSGHRASTSGYHRQASFDAPSSFVRDPLSGYRADHPGREGFREAPGTASDGISGGYSYTSSYDDLNRRYGYGTDSGSHLTEAYRGGSFDGSSAHHYDFLHRSFPSPRTSAFGKDVGYSFGSRRLAFGEEELISDRCEGDLGFHKKILDDESDPYAMPRELAALNCRRNPDDEFSYSLKAYGMQHEPPLSTDYLRGSMMGTMKNDQSSFLGANMHDRPVSGLFPSCSGSLYDLESAGGPHRLPEELGWSSFAGLHGLGHEQDAFCNTRNIPSLMDSRAYSHVREHGKLNAWNGETGKQAELDAGSKERIMSSFLGTETVANGNKQANNVETSIMPEQDVGFSKSSDTVKKRRTRWEPLEENEKSAEDATRKAKKKTRWSAEKSPVKETSFPDIMKEIPVESADIVALRARLIVIGKMLKSGQLLQDQNAERSPSPEPMFDSFGFRINTRENRAREKLNGERQRIMARLSEKMIESNGKPLKLSKKIYVPVDKYPGYNFVGLILGPRGNTQKQMQKESGARIFIRGRGSAKANVGGTNSLMTDSEDLHVLIEADTEDAINKASKMVESILVPVEDGQNELKRAQLRELGFMNENVRINGTAFDGNLPFHAVMDFPIQGISIPGSKFLKDSPLVGNSSASLMGGALVQDDIDISHLHVAQLPLHIDDAKLFNLFSPFGKLISAKVINNPITGTSLGNGLVKFVDAADAGQAAALMNGYEVDGKVLAVKVKTMSEPAI